MTTIVTTTSAIERHMQGHAGPRMPALLADPATATLNQRRDRMLAEAAIAWARRVTGLELRKGTAKRAAQVEAFLQGVLAVMTSGNYMSIEEANRIGFLVAVGRAEEVIVQWAALGAPAATPRLDSANAAG